MSKPTAVIDLSLFHQICKEACESKRDFYWKSLCDKYQLIVPMVLIEEVLVNRVAKPGRVTDKVLERMTEKVLRLQHCWMQDVNEMAFVELVERRPLTKFIAPHPQIFKWLQTLNVNDPKLVKWVEDRKVNAKGTARDRKRQQDKLAQAATSDHVSSEKEFFERTVRREFEWSLHEPTRIRDILETVFGDQFRRRHPDRLAQIEEVFANYGPDTFRQFPLTLSFLLVRLAYLFAPVVKIQPAEDSELRKILKRSAGEQVNNPADEQYVVSALACDRLLTRDGGMNNIAAVFQAIGPWKCKPVFFCPKGVLSDQIPRLLV